VDPGTAGRAKQLTTGQGTRSARCGESRTPGAVGGSRETNGGNTETAPAVLPNLRHAARASIRHLTGLLRDQRTVVLRMLGKTYATRT
jgi:hypothetical protein